MTPSQWHAYIQDAPNIGAMLERVEQAVRAGIDSADLLAAQEGSR